MHNDLWKIEVDKLFWPGIQSWPERFEYRVFDGNHMLQICAGRLKKRDIEAFHRGPIHLGLFLSEGVAFVLFKLDGLYDWSDQAISMGLVHAADREIPPLQEGTYQLLNVVLVEAETGLVKGMRAVTWSPHAASVLHRALSQQLETSFDLARHAEVVAKVYAQHPNSKALARAALLRERAGTTL